MEQGRARSPYGLRPDYVQEGKDQVQGDIFERLYNMAVSQLASLDPRTGNTKPLGRWWPREALLEQFMQPTTGVVHELSSRLTSHLTLFERTSYRTVVVRLNEGKFQVAILSLEI